MRIPLLVEPCIAARATPHAVPCSSVSSNVVLCSPLMCITWDVQPSIPLGSPVHRWRLRDMFTCPDTVASRFALFLCRPVKQPGSDGRYQWEPVAIVDPSQSAFDLGLKDTADVVSNSDDAQQCCLLTIFPQLLLKQIQQHQQQKSKSSRLTLNHRQLVTTASENRSHRAGAVFSNEIQFQSNDSELGGALESAGFVAPMDTAALRYLDMPHNVMAIRGRSKRRCVRVTGAAGGAVHWDPRAIAVAAFPHNTFCVPPSASSRLRSSAAGDDALHDENSTMLHWSCRVTYRAPPRGVDEDALVDRLIDQTPGDDFFDDDEDATMGHDEPAPPSESSQKATDESNGEDPSMDSTAGVGIPLPSVLIGFGLREPLEALLQSTTDASAGQRSTPLHLRANTNSVMPPNSVCLFEPITGCLVTNRPAVDRETDSSAQTSTSSFTTSSVVAYADLDALQYDLNAVFRFSLDASRGIVNVTQDGRLLVVAKLPAEFTEAIAAAIDAHVVQNHGSEAGHATPSRALQAALLSSIAVVVQIGTLWGTVDIY